MPTLGPSTGCCFLHGCVISCLARDAFVGMWNKLLGVNSCFHAVINNRNVLAGKWNTLLSTLSNFKRDYDTNRALSRCMVCSACGTRLHDQQLYICAEALAPGPVLLSTKLRSTC
jgi:hypothetical protein